MEKKKAMQLLEIALILVIFSMIIGGVISLLMSLSWFDEKHELFPKHELDETYRSMLPSLHSRMLKINITKEFHDV